MSTRETGGSYLEGGLAVEVLHLLVGSTDQQHSGAVVLQEEKRRRRKGLEGGGGGGGNSSVLLLGRNERRIRTSQKNTRPTQHLEAVRSWSALLLRSAERGRERGMEREREGWRDGELRGFNLLHRSPTTCSTTHVPHTHVNTKTVFSSTMSS